MKSVTINNKQLPAVEYHGQRVVTFAMVDEVHGRPEGTAGRNFRENKVRFIAGVDYFELGSDEIRTSLPEGVFSKFSPSGIVLTESGYLMVVKSLTDDLAWQVQRELVNSYFRTREPLSEIEMIAAMAADAVRQQKRLSHVEEQVVVVTETLEQIKKGTMPDGMAGYSLLRAKCGMTDAKCRNLVSAYQIPTDTHEFLTPEGLMSKRGIVHVANFMDAFRQMMSEAEQRGTRWYHPKMGLFQAIGWGAAA